MNDFGFITDTKDIQAVEMCCRRYYFTRTRLLALCGDKKNPKDSDFDSDQVDRIISKMPDMDNTVEANDAKNQSLYHVDKVMFRVNGIVMVAWSCSDTCDDWVRKPRPLYIGMREVMEQPVQMSLQAPSNTVTNGVPMNQIGAPTQSQTPQTKEQYETEYPYVIFPYLISENDTISQSKGRVFLDQDLQEAVSSLTTSTVTKARRSAGLYFSRDTSDPNDDILMDKNIFFKSGCIFSSRLQAFELKAPDATMFTAIQALEIANQNETSQPNFAVQNRKDSRKTAKEITVSEKQEQILSTVQVVLFNIALTQVYRKMVKVIKSRVQSGLIQVLPTIRSLYDRKFTVKPSGDVDVIEKQQLIKQMMDSWQVVQNTPAGPLFMCDLLELMFPDRSAKYIQAIQQAQQQNNSQQQQQTQQMMQFALHMAKGIQHLASRPEYFSEIGRIHALPQIIITAEQIDNMQKQLTNNQTQPANK